MVLIPPIYDDLGDGLLFYPHYIIIDMFGKDQDFMGIGHESQWCISYLDGFRHWNRRKYAKMVSIHPCLSIMPIDKVKVCLAKNQHVCFQKPVFRCLGHMFQHNRYPIQNLTHQQNPMKNPVKHIKSHSTRIEMPLNHYKMPSNSIKSPSDHHQSHWITIKSHQVPLNPIKSPSNHP